MSCVSAHAHKHGVQEARPRLPALFEHLCADFARRGSLRAPYDDVLASVRGMHLASAHAGLSQHEARLHLQLLARAAPEWLRISKPASGAEVPAGRENFGVHNAGGRGGVRMVTISKDCAGVRARLDDIAHGYAHV